MKVSETNFGKTQPGGALTVIRNDGTRRILRLRPEEYGLKVSNGHDLLIEMAYEIIKLNKIIAEGGLDAS